MTTTPGKVKTNYCTDQSRALYERTKNLLIEGGSSSSRGPLNFGECPIFMVHGSGSRIFDADGNEYVDWMMAFGALPHGHADPDITQAIAEGAASGAHFATTTDIEIEVAQLIQQMVPNAERVRFASTGTEAVMAAVRLARGYTGRPKLLKFEGHYHGWYDDLLVSSNPQPISSLGYKNDPVKIVDSSGLNRHAVDDTIVVPWNDLSAAERAFANHPGQIAAVISEGIMANMGVILPEDGYLQKLQHLCRENGTLFILDETVTGFRIAPGGCQEFYQLSPDIVTFGKALGCGLPVAAFVGRAEVMNALEWGGVLHYGTQNASRIGMFAARANLRKMRARNGAYFEHIWKIGAQLTQGLRDLIARTGTAAIVQGTGPMFQVMFTTQREIRNYRDYCAFVDRNAYRRFVHSLFPQGVFTTPSATLHSIVSFAHTPQDVEFTLEATERALTTNR